MAAAGLDESLTSNDFGSGLDTAWQLGADGAQWFDGESADPRLADPVLDLANIAPGETVVIVIGIPFDVTNFSTVRGSVVDLSNVVVGFVEGAALGRRLVTG